MHCADLTPIHVRGARAVLGWSQGDLAEAAAMAASTIKRLETVTGALEKADTSTKKAIFNAFSKAGIAFYGGGEPGVRLMLQPQPIAD